MKETRLSADALADIQGFVTSGYGHLPLAAYLFLNFRDAVAVRRWLALVVPAITSSSAWPTSPTGEKIKPAVAVNVALTADGLRAMGLSAAILATFPVEFQEGIAQDLRSRILGDTEESDPAMWELGGTKQPSIHALMLIHAISKTELDLACQRQRALIGATSGGVVELPDTMQNGYRPDGDYEPFGFHDGIAQPSIAGINADGGDGVPTGEFILGYLNHYGILPPMPAVPAALDADARLAPLENPYHATQPLKDLGLNGSFVVYRKLQQDIAGFWEFMKRETIRTTGTEDTARMVWLASRLVGRWPSGAPLALAPHGDDPAMSDRDDFLYREDPDGLACPLGAHIRRVNPRDNIKPYPAPQSRSMSEAHRLLRRARVFGPALINPAALPAVTSLVDDGRPRGIHFFCVNASIRSQFEFVQQNWCNNPRFGGLNDNKDPITGDNARTNLPPSRMTIPGSPARQRTAALPRFVTVKGGAYLFMPSVRALRFLASLPAHD